MTFLLLKSQASRERALRDNTWTLGCNRCYPTYEWSEENGYTVLTVTHTSPYVDGSGECRNNYSGGRFAFTNHPMRGTLTERLT